MAMSSEIILTDDFSLESSKICKLRRNAAESKEDDKGNE